MGCASTTKPGSEQNETPDAAHVNHCNKQSSFIDNSYPWSIPGHHDTLTKHPPSFNITQARGKPNQFIVCSDCPCPTPKNATERKQLKDKTASKSNPKKVVVLFDHASYLLNERQQQILARLYQSLPDQYQLTITGYTDDTSPGGIITNKTLAQLRAESVLDFLVTLGIKESHTTIKASPLCCYVSPNTTDSGRALNRRAEIIITSSSTNR